MGGIVSDQQAEIEGLSSIKKKEFGSSGVATEINPEDPSMIKRLARRIIDAQSREVGQMIGWRQQWYPEG